MNHPFGPEFDPDLGSGFSPRPFPLPVVAVGVGAQPEDEELDVVTMPQGMATYRAPVLPEAEVLGRRAGAVAALTAVLAALDTVLAGGRPAPVPLDGLGEADLALVGQVLGEGEVGAQVLPRPGQWRAQVQESVLAGVWRVLREDADGTLHDRLEVGPVPALLHEAAAEDAQAGPRRPPLGAAPEGIVNAPALLAELADRRARWQPGEAAHVVNLTLLPLTPADIAWLDHGLGTGRVLILSRGYGNCRITNAEVAHTWRVVYYNSQDQVILNAAEVTALPDVACAAPEDFADSRERLAEILAWVALG